MMMIHLNTFTYFFVMIFNNKVTVKRTYIKMNSFLVNISF